MNVWRGIVAVAAVMAVAAVLAACGGAGDEAGTTVGTGADFVPAGAPLYAYVNTDDDSDQRDDLEALVDRFPDGDELGQQLIAALAEEGLDYDEDVEPALGPEVVFALLSFAGGVDANLLGVTKPDDGGKFDELIRKLRDANPDEPAVTRSVDGWRVVAGSEAALDEAEQAHAGTSLADDETFQQAIGELPDEALLKLYLDGAAAARELGDEAGALSDLVWASLAVTAQGDGIGVDSAARTDRDPPPAFRPTLLGHVPAGALVAASFRSTGPLDDDVGEDLLERFGVGAGDLATLFDREGVFYVRLAIPIPEVTVVLADGAAAGDTLDRVMRAIAAATGGTVEPAGEGEKELRYDDFRVRYGLVEDKLVVTTAAQGITVIREGGDALADDPEFEDAAEAAGMPEETASFVYVNLEDAVPALLGLVQVAGAGEQLDPRTRENLEPLKSFLAYAVPEGSLVRGKGFLRID